MGSDLSDHGPLSEVPWKIGRALPPGQEEESFAIRDATGADLDALMFIENRAHQAPWTREVFERELEIEWSYTWLMEGPKQSGGGVALLVFWVIHDEIHILDVAVDPDHRRKGLAKLMIGELITLAGKNPIALMTLEVRVSNVAAQGLYESLGFERLGRRPRYYQDNDEDAWVMSRSIEEY